ncbi:MAG: four helix bundle protein, partial [Coraliomargarita sp.]
LTSQLRRAAVSIPANIAEGYGKRSSADKARFYNIAQGSLNECRYYLRLATDLSYAETNTLKNQLNEIGKMLNSYTRKVSSTSV